MKPLRLHRRTILRAGGVSLALPWLEAMTLPGRAAARAIDPAVAPRALFLYFPSGYRRGQWVKAAPAGSASSTSFTLPPVARALEPWKHKLTLITGLTNKPASVDSSGAGIHSRGTGCSLTCDELRPGGFQGEGVSADQVIVKEAASEGCLSSLVLGLPHERVPSFSEEGYGALYYNNVSFSGPRSQVQKISDPSDLFLRVTTCPGWKDGPTRERRALFERRVMGSVKEKAQRLMSCAGQGDRLRLEEYFTSVSELERRFLPASPRTASCARPLLPPAVGNTLAESASAMFDLTVLALRCGLTRVGTLMMDGALSRRSYGLPELGGANYIHGLSHGEIGGEGADGPRWVRLTTHYFELFAALLARLDAVVEGERTLLDNTIVYIHSEFGDGDVHQFGEQPLIIAGGGGGRLRMGQHLSLPAETPQANALLTVMQAMGVKRTSFGDSTGPLPALVA